MDRRKPLAAMLHAYQPVDAQESDHRARMLALLATAGDSCARDHFAPGHFTASAFVLSPDARGLLLIHHSKLDRWLQPGGHVEPGDADLLAAARRELHEEVGLRDLALELPGVLDLDVHAIAPRAGEPAHQHFDVRFLFRADSYELLAGSDAKAARWFELSCIDELQADRSVMRAVKKLLHLARPGARPGGPVPR